MKTGNIQHSPPSFNVAAYDGFTFYSGLFVIPPCDCCTVSKLASFNVLK